MIRALAWAPVVLAALLLTALASQPLWLGPLVARSIEQDSGRSVRIERLWVGLSTSLQPVVQFRAIRIENAPWADRSLPLIDAREVAALVAWRSLWAERRIISLLVLRDGQIDLERQADGLRNWRLHNPEDRGPGRYRVLALQAERSSLRLVQGAVDLVLEARATPNTEDAPSAGGPPLPSRLDFVGHWRKLPFTAQVAAGPMLTFYETHDTFPLRGRFEAGGATLEAEGRAADILQQPLLDARVLAEGKSLLPFRAFLGAKVPPAKGFRIEGQLTAAGHRLALADAKGRLGGTDLAGSISLDRGGERPAYAADLRSDTTDLADWQWLAGPSASSAAAAPAARAASAAAPASGAASPAGFAALRRFDADVRYAANHLRLPAEPWLQSVKVEARLAAGQLRLAAFDLGLAGGHASGSASLDASAAPPLVQADLGWRAVRVEALLPEQKDGRRVTGALHGKALLRASGSSLEALLGSAAGDARLTLGGGTIASLLDAEMGLQGGKIMRSLVGGSEPIALRCALLDAHLEQGKARIRALVIDSARTRTQGSGSFDLGRRTIDIVLTPQAKERSLLVLDRSIHLSGPAGKPQKALIERRAEPAAASCAP